MLDFFAFIRRKWAEYSQFSGQKGTPIDELAVKPASLILSDFYNSMVDQSRANDITNWKNMTDAQLDAFGGKFFRPRALGDYAFGSVRIWFNKKTDIEISTSFRAISTTNAQFRAIQPGRISKNSMRISRDNTAPFYIDVQIIAISQGNTFDCEKNTVTSLSGITFQYVSVTNPEPIKGGVKRESNEEYSTRLLYAINDGSMSNQRSFISRLPEIFPSVTSVYLAGAGNNYMSRDLVSARDLTKPIQKAEYLGKIAGDSSVKHMAFDGIFPPPPGNVHADMWGPHSIISNYQYPLTIDPARSQLTRIDDPALFGYPLDQEFLDAMYRGVYFNDFNNFFGLSTSDLFNILEDNTSTSKVAAPNSDWKYGAHGFKSGNYGALESESISGIDVISFEGGTITMSGGAKNSLSINKDIKKRTGVKLTGTFKWPEVTSSSDATANSNLQLMVGGINTDFVEGYTGIGFGVRLFQEYTPWDGSTDNANAIIYFAHSENYSNAQVFATQDDINSGTGITDLGSLAETSFRIEPGIEYEFEFVINDDLRLTLYLNKLTNRNLSYNDENENFLHYQLPSKALKAFSSDPDKGIMAIDTTRYGTTMKVTLDTGCLDPSKSWVINNLKAFNTASHRASALFALDVDKLEEPGIISLRTFGSGAVSGSAFDGYRAFIWDKESDSAASSETELTSGAWAELSGVTNPDGSKLAGRDLLNHTLNNFDRYKIQSRYGNNIFILVTTTGESRASSLFSGETIDDIQSNLRVDYLSIESGNIDSYHANNKCDAYVVTYKNSETLDRNTVSLTKHSGESFFEMSSATGCVMPIADIISVTAGGQSLSSSDYTVVGSDPLFSISSKEVIRIALNGRNYDSITVEYDSYPNVSDMQAFFDGAVKIYGDMLVRHKTPCVLDFSVYYTGDSTNDQLVTAIRAYVDDNNSDMFIVRDFINYLYDGKFVNSIQEPISISYTMTDSNNNKVSGTFSDKLSIREIDFFRIGSVSINRV